MAQHERTIEAHVKGNVVEAIDQADEFGGLENAFFSYLQNTTDSVIADGYTAEEAFDAGNWYCTMFTEKTGHSF